MGHGALSVFTKSIATNGSITSVYDLSRGWDKVYLQIPDLVNYISTATCNIYIWGSDSADGTFYQVVHPPANSATTAMYTFTIASTASQAVSPIPNGIRYVKVQVGNTATAAVDFKIICSD